MIRKEQRATLLQRQTVTNTYNEQVAVWQPVGEMDIVIGYKSGIANLQDDVMTTLYTITGLTNDARPQAQDKIECAGKTYTIQSTVDTARKRILNLTEDRVIG